MQRRSFLAVTGTVAIGGCGANPAPKGGPASDAASAPNSPAAAPAPPAVSGRVPANAAPPPPPPDADDGSAPSEPAPTELDLLFGIVQLRHGGRLSEEELADIRRELAANLATAERLRAVPLDNRDEPVFAPLRPSPGQSARVAR